MVRDGMGECLLDGGYHYPQYQSVLVGRFWLVGPVGQKMAVAISNSFYVVFCPILAPIPNFIQIR